MSTDTVDLARRVPDEIATQGNLTLVEEVFAEDATEHAPFGQEVRAIDAIRASLRSYRAAFPDFSATVEETVSEGDMVAMRVTLRGTHGGPFMGIEPTNRSLQVGNMVFTRIAERWLQPDTLGLLQQLGIVELPPMQAPKT